jgi:hypothetical protein
MVRKRTLPDQECANGENFHLWLQEKYSESFVSFVSFVVSNRFVN